ncbi:MAG: CaiB/BaiF CoA transferase family protein [Candidatus Dormibacterales bacterium]
MSGAPPPLPLEGVTVIDCGQVIAGPTIAMLLGDFGAEVIKVENPRGGDQVRNFGYQKAGASLHSKLLSRNKKSITLNLGDVRGQELFCRLVRGTSADILVESFRPGTLERWGLTFERLRALSPGLTMIRVSGFGQTGPYRDRPGFGTLAEAMSGFAHVTGAADGPPTLPPFALADTIAALYATVGALVSLYHRDARGYGRGQCLDVSLLEPIFNVLGTYLMEYDQLGMIPQRRGNRTSSAPRNTYRTRDGRWIALAGSTQSVAVRLFAALGQPEMAEDPRFSTNRARVANAEPLDEIVGAWVGQRTQAEAIEALVDAEVAVAPIWHVGDLAADEHVRARGAIETVDDPELGPIRMPAVQPRLSETPGRIRHAGPRLGEHNYEVYVGRLGLAEAEVAELVEEGVI